MTDWVLHQFLYSHFNEKVRWALTWKQVPHRRKSYLPGPHIPRLRRLSGQSQTPVLANGDEVVAGSAAIIDLLENRYPQPPLYPADPGARARALGIQQQLDTELGPATRTVLFSVLMNEGGYLTRMFARDANPLTRALYRATFPVARGMIAEANGVNDPENVKAAFEITRRTMDRIVEDTSATGCLCGTAFTVADLTAASLLAPLVTLSHPDMVRPQPVPQTLASLYGEWQAHPAAAWVSDQYRRHRASAEAAT